MLCSSITDQLVAAEKCLCQFPEVGNRPPDKSRSLRIISYFSNKTCVVCTQMNIDPDKEILLA